jgi:hypothetical protein
VLYCIVGLGLFCCEHICNCFVTFCYCINFVPHITNHLFLLFHFLFQLLFSFLRLTCLCLSAMYAIVVFVAFAIQAEQAHRPIHIHIYYHESHIHIHIHTHARIHAYRNINTSSPLFSLFLSSSSSPHTFCCVIVCSSSPCSCSLPLLASPLPVCGVQCQSDSNMLAAIVSFHNCTLSYAKRPPCGAISTV